MRSQPDFSTRSRRSRRGQRDTALLGAALVALLLSAGAVWSAWAALRAARADVTRVRRETQDVVAKTKTIESQRGADELTVSRALLTAEAPPPRVLADLESLLPAEVRLGGLTLLYGAELQVEMQVTARRPEAYDEFIQLLERSPAFADVVPGEETRNDQARGSIRASYLGVGGS